MAITVQTENGSQVFEGKAVSLTRNEQTFEPTFVSNVTTEISGNVESVTEMCGRTEEQKNGDGNWKMTIEGVIVHGELSTLQTFARGSQITVSAEVLGDRGGEFIVQDTTIEHVDELNSFEVITGRGADGTLQSESPENAYEFQLQLKEPEPNA